MLVSKKMNIYFAMELNLREISFVVYVHTLMTRKSCNVLNNNSRSHMKSLTVFVSTAIDSVNVVISRERFEHELTWLAFKKK